MCSVIIILITFKLIPFPHLSILGKGLLFHCYTFLITFFGYADYFRKRSQKFHDFQLLISLIPDSVKEIILPHNVCCNKGESDLIFPFSLCLDFYFIALNLAWLFITAVPLFLSSSTASYKASFQALNAVNHLPSKIKKTNESSLYKASFSWA